MQLGDIILGRDGVNRRKKTTCNGGRWFEVFNAWP